MNVRHPHIGCFPDFQGVTMMLTPDKTLQQFIRAHKTIYWSFKKTPAGFAKNMCQAVITSGQQCQKHSSNLLRILCLDFVLVLSSEPGNVGVASGPTPLY